MVLANLSVEILSVVINVIIILFFILNKRKIAIDAKIFVAMLITNFFILVFDVTVNIIPNEPQFVSILIFLKFFVFILGNIFFAEFIIYIIVYISQKTKSVPNFLIPLILSFSVFSIVFTVIAMFDKLYFYYDETGALILGKHYWLCYVHPLLMIILGLIIIFYYTKKLGFKDFFVLSTYGIYPIIALVLQIIFPELRVVYVGATLSMLVVYVKVQLERNNFLMKKELELSQANISMLMTQIQPHFLYNALNTIQCLCDDDPQTASMAIEKFSKYLRGNMDALTKKELVSFEDEINNMQNYLYLEKLRFDDRVNVEYDFKVTDFFLPILTVQPLVENAIRHGITKKPEGGTIKISTRKYADGVILTIADDGVGFNVEEKRKEGTRSHIGLTNVKTRIEIQCGATFSIKSEIGKGTDIEMVFPISGGEKSGV